MAFFDRARRNNISLRSFGGECRRFAALGGLGNSARKAHARLGEKCAAFLRLNETDAA
jgi:hypothetical protein